MPEPICVQQPGKLLAQIFLAWPGEKRKQIRTWLKFKAITVNGLPTTRFDHPLKRGDTVAVRTDTCAQPGEKLTSGIRIRHEDAEVIVIEKPSGLLSISSLSQRDRTAYAYLMEHVRLGPRAARARVWIVHRLDKETSGLMVFGKSEQAKVALQEQWSQAEKKYQAIVSGVPPHSWGVLESYLDETGPHKVLSAPMSSSTRLAITEYQVLQKTGGRSLLGLTLQTGRRHQIRVQLADLGCPIVGDQLYEPKEARKGEAKQESKTAPRRKRLALHACELRFTHPTTGKEMTFLSPLPSELRLLMEKEA